MEWLNKMNKSLEYIEDHLMDKVSYDEAARIACCSVYHYQRVFSFIAGVPVSEYIRRRRLTLAAFELQSSGVRVIDAAFKYGYESPEAFSRAFKSLHGVMPLSARERGVQLKAFPRMSFFISIKGDAEMNYRIESKEAFEMCGFTTEISTVDDQNYFQVPQFWLDNFENGNIDRFHDDIGLDRDECVHAALYDFRDGVYAYMICYYTPEGGVPEGYTALSVPELTWAVFSTPEHTNEETSNHIQNVWKRIFPEWFPTSGYEHADGPEFEMYYNKGNGLYVAEVWIPVVKK